MVCWPLSRERVNKRMRPTPARTNCTAVANPMPDVPPVRITPLSEKRLEAVFGGGARSNFNPILSISAISCPVDISCFLIGRESSNASSVKAALSFLVSADDPVFALLA